MESVEWTTREREITPLGELAVRRNAQVEAMDGHSGRVAGFLVDAETRGITHVVVRQGHLWDQEEMTVPVSQIARSMENTVYLKLDKKAAKSLPVVAVKRVEGLDELFESLHAAQESVRQVRTEQTKTQLKAWDAEIEKRLAASRARRKAARAERRKELEADMAQIDVELGENLQMLAGGMAKMAADEVSSEEEQKAEELRARREEARIESEELRALMDADERDVD